MIQAQLSPDEVDLVRFRINTPRGEQLRRLVTELKLIDNIDSGVN